MLYVPQEKGQGLFEYALIIVLIAILLIALLILFKSKIEIYYSRIASGIPH